MENVRIRFNKTLFVILILALILLLVAIFVSIMNTPEVKSDEMLTPDPFSSPYPWPSPTRPVNFKIPSKDVFTFECESVERKPSSIYFACADGGEGIQNIKWSTWSVNGALGTGEYFHNLCEPNCAEGKYEYSKVDIALFRPIQMGNKVFLTKISYSAKGQPIDMNAGGDLSEFFRLMNE